MELYVFCLVCALLLGVVVINAIFCLMYVSYPLAGGAAPCPPLLVCCPRATAGSRKRRRRGSPGAVGRRTRSPIRSPAKRSGSAAEAMIPMRDFDDEIDARPQDQSSSSVIIESPSVSLQLHPPAVHSSGSHERSRRILGDPPVRRSGMSPRRSVSPSLAPAAPSSSSPSFGRSYDVIELGSTASGDAGLRLTGPGGHSAIAAPHYATAVGGPTIVSGSYRTTSPRRRHGSPMSRASPMTAGQLDVAAGGVVGRRPLSPVVADSTVVAAASSVGPDESAGRARLPASGGANSSPYYAIGTRIAEYAPRTRVDPEITTSQPAEPTSHRFETRPLSYSAAVATSADSRYHRASSPTPQAGGSSGSGRGGTQRPFSFTASGGGDYGSLLSSARWPLASSTLTRTGANPAPASPSSSTPAGGQAARGDGGGGTVMSDVRSGSAATVYHSTKPLSTSFTAGGLKSSIDDYLSSKASGLQMAPSVGSHNSSGRGAAAAASEGETTTTRTTEYTILYPQQQTTSPLSTSFVTTRYTRYPSSVTTTTTRQYYEGSASPGQSADASASSIAPPPARSSTPLAGSGGATDGETRVHTVTRSVSRSSSSGGPSRLKYGQTEI